MRSTIVVDLRPARSYRRVVDEISPKRVSFDQLLDLFDLRAPKLMAHLRRVQRNREGRLYLLSLDSSALNGLEDVLSGLEHLVGIFQREDSTRAVALLLERAQADFHIALSALVDGFHSVLNDSMRDVIEIELLLRDFSYDPDRAAKWLTATREQPRKDFSARAVRDRVARNLTGQEGYKLPDENEYSAHSELLHVTPLEAATDMKKLFADPGHGSLHNGIQEIGRHSMTLFQAANSCLRAFQLPDNEAAPRTGHFRRMMDQANLQLAERLTGAGFPVPDRKPEPRPKRSRGSRAAGGTDASHD